MLKEIQDSHHKRSLFKITADLIQYGKRKSFKKGDTVYSKGEKVHGIYYIEFGYLGLIDQSVSGVETLLRVFGKNEITGHRSFLSEEVSHASCVALTDSELLFFPFETPKDCLIKDESLFFHITRNIASDLRVAEERLSGVSGKKVASRVIEGLLYLKMRYPGHVWTRREIGDFCVAKTETVTRVLSKLESLGLIQKDGRDLLIPDKSALLEYSEELTIE